MKVFGKQIGALAIMGAILAVGATAMLVSYLSNTATVNTEVDSPLAVDVSYDSIDWDTDISAAAYGGDTIDYYARVENRANAEITGNMTVNAVTSTGMATCADFTLIELYDAGVWTDITALCTDTTSGTTVGVPVTYLPFETEQYEVRVTLDPAVAPTTYTFSHTVNVNNV